METSDQFDRKRRRMKSRGRQSWAKCLLRPQTLKSLIAVGRLVTRVVWLIYSIVRVFRE